jgi:hypothetical protein
MFNHCGTQSEHDHNPIHTGKLQNITRECTRHHTIRLCVRVFFSMEGILMRIKYPPNALGNFMCMCTNATLLSIHKE